MAKRFTTEAVFKVVDRFTAPVKKFERQLRGFSKQWDDAPIRRWGKSFRGAVDGAAKSLGKLKVAFAASVAVGGVVAKSVIDSGAALQQTFANLRAVSGATDAELDALRQTTFELGKQFGFMPDQVAGAMESMSKAGFSVDDIKASIGALAAAAAADGSTIDEATGSIMAAMKSLGLGASDAQMFSDMMAKAGDATAASIGSISESMAIFGPVVKQLGIPLDQAIAQVALLQDAGLNASSVGTSLAATYSKLVAPAGKAARTMKDLGINVKDAAGNMKAPNVLLQELAQAASKFHGNADKMKAISDLVGLESQKALLNLTQNAEGGGLQSLVSDLAQASGYAAEIGAVKMDTFTGDVSKLKATVEALKVQLFDTQSGALRGVVQTMTAWVEANGELMVQDIAGFLQTIADNIGSIVKWGQRIAAVVGVFYAMSLAVEAVTLTITVAKGLMVAFSAAVKIFKGLMVAARIAVFLFNLALAANPFVLIAMAIAAAIALLVIFWDDIVAFFSGFTEGFSEVWDSIVSGAETALRTIGQFLINLLTGPLRMVMTGLEKIGVLDAGTVASFEQAISIQSPQERAFKSGQDSGASVNGEITVSAEQGTKARIKQNAKGRSGVRLQATGAL